MTPKEKAEELIVKFSFARNDDHEQFVAKQCALICVEEILYVLGEPTYFKETREFYLKVKSELEK